MSSEQKKSHVKTCVELESHSNFTGMPSAINMNEAHFLKERDHRDNKIARVVNDIAKFTVDFTLTASLKGVSGPKKLYEIVQERFKNPPTSSTLNNCKKREDVKLSKRMQIKVEEMLEDMGKLKVENETSAKCVEGKEPLEDVPDEGSKRSYVLEPEKKRIFIRSRL